MHLILHSFVNSDASNMWWSISELDLSFRNIRRGIIIRQPTSAWKPSQLFYRQCLGEPLLYQPIRFRSLSNYEHTPSLLQWNRRCCFSGKNSFKFHNLLVQSYDVDERKYLGIQISQMGTFWEDDLQSVVQMDIGQTQEMVVSSQSFNGKYSWAILFYFYSVIHGFLLTHILWLNWNRSIWISSHENGTVITRSDSGDDAFVYMEMAACSGRSFKLTIYSPKWISI